MKKTFVIFTVVLFTAQISYAGFYSEKDIGTCIKKNSKGWCIESKTHYCSDSGNAYTGKCELWLKKGTDPFQDIMKQYNSFNEDFYKGVSNTPVKKNSQAATKSNITNSKQTTNISNVESKALEAEKAIIPNSIKISQSIKDIDTKIQILQARQSAGIDVSNELELLKYKSQKLWQLNDLRDKFSNIYHNYTNGIITKSEYEGMTAELRKNDIELVQPYQQIMATTLESMEKEKAEALAKTEAEQKRQRKKEIGRKLLDQGTLFVPPAASNWIRQGADALELLK